MYWAAIAFAWFTDYVAPTLGSFGLGLGVSNGIRGCGVYGFVGFLCGLWPST